MGRHPLIVFLSILSATLFAQEHDVYLQMSDMLMNNNESIASISFGITVDRLHALRNGVVSKVISEGDYNGFFGDAISIQTETEYYLGDEVIRGTYYTIYSNLDLNPQLRVGDDVDRKTLLGTMANRLLPFDGGTDLKIVVFSTYPDHHELIFYNQGRSAITLPGVDGLYLHLGQFLLQNRIPDLLQYVPLAELENLDPLLLLADQNAPVPEPDRQQFSYDLVYRFRIKLLHDRAFQPIGDATTRLFSFIDNLNRTTDPPVVPRTNTVASYSVNGHVIHMILSDHLYSYFQDEITIGMEPVYYLRSLGYYREAPGELHYVFFVTEFSAVSLEEYFNHTPK